MTNRALDALAIDTIRTLSMDAVQKANSGHPGTPMALAPVGWRLYANWMRHNPSDPLWPGRDRFVLSCGHASMLQYALLHLSGYDLSIEDIKAFRQWGSKTAGHPEVFHTPGVETTTGPLGQGVANAVGMAMARDHLAGRLDKEAFDQTIWVIASDGDLMEGVASEACSLAGHLQLKNFVIFWDDNEITIDGRTSLTFSEDVSARFASYGFETFHVPDGNDLDALDAVAEAAKNCGKPAFVRLQTKIGYPSPNKQDTSSAHGSPLGDEEIALTKAAMGWEHPAFHVPEELSAVREEIVARGQAAQNQWSAKANVEAIAKVIAKPMPENALANLPGFEVDAKGMATRAASGKVFAQLADQLPSLIGGSADLTGSNKTKFDADRFGGEGGVPRLVNWGVREHGMGAIMNGMALFGGTVPLGATFLVFADYMRPAIRMAALMGLRTRYVLSHDSIGLGEDGPTHQPIETLASLRAIPGLLVLRPADANETREAWIAAMNHDGPAALVLTRQSVPTLDADATKLHQGAYEVLPCDAPQAILIGTGSEVHIALEAGRRLTEDGIPTRVVSVPAWELIEEEGMRLMRSAGAKTLVIEAGVRQGWDRYAGADAHFITLEHFGASAPYETLYREFGLTADAIVAKIRA